MRTRYTFPCDCFGSEFRSDVAARIHNVGWAIFLVWVGAAFLFDVGWGIGLLGIGFLTLAMQLVRRRFGLRFEGFWVIVGGAFTVAGVWKLAGIEVSPVPIALMALGVCILLSALRGKGAVDPRTEPEACCSDVDLRGSGSAADR